MSNLKPIGSNIFFKFHDKTHNGHFVETHSSGIILDAGQNHAYSTRYSRTGDVVAVGPEVKDIKPGDKIVIKTLMWTDHSFDLGNEGRAWMTNERHVLGTL